MEIPYTWRRRYVIGRHLRTQKGFSTLQPLPTFSFAFVFAFSRLLMQIWGHGMWLCTQHRHSLHVWTPSPFSFTQCTINNAICNRLGTCWRGILIALCFWLRGEYIAFYCGKKRKEKITTIVNSLWITHFHASFISL